MGQTKFQRSKEPSHTRIYRRLMASPAFRAMSGSAFKVLVDLASLERGENNGAIYYSSRFGAERTGLSRNTVWRALAELIDKGVIYCTQAGGFSRKTPHAATYGLTWVAGPKGTVWRAPSHAYEEWQVPENGNTRSQFLTPTVPNIAQPMETDLAAVTEMGTGELEKRLVSVDPSVSNIVTHTSNQAHGAGEPETKQRKQAGPILAADIADLRERLTMHLDANGAGEQTRLADRLGIPGGTLSKFINGKNLPTEYRGPLLAAVA